MISTYYGWVELFRWEHSLQGMQPFLHFSGACLCLPQKCKTYTCSVGLNGKNKKKVQISRSLASEVVCTSILHYRSIAISLAMMLTSCPQGSDINNIPCLLFILINFQIQYIH